MSAYITLFSAQITVIGKTIDQLEKMITDWNWS